MKRLIMTGLLAAFCGAEHGLGQVSNTVITSDQMTFDYKNSKAICERNVKVVDPQLSMVADRMVLNFDGTNSVKSVTATGQVKLWQDDKTATCQKAVYTAESGEITLTGKVLVVRAGDSLETEEVTFWVNEDRMHCPLPSKVVISPISKADDNPALRPKK